MRTTRCVISSVCALLLSVLLVGPAAAGESRPAGGQGSATLGQVQARGTHNSFKLDPQWPGRELFGWDYQHQRLPRQLEEQDVRQVELDVHYNWARDQFEVYHAWLGDDRTSCRRLADCLEQIRWWSDLRPHHHPILILVEPKDGGPPRNEGLPEDGDPFTHPIGEREYRQLDRVLLESFDGPVSEGGRVLTPDEVTAEGRTLRESVLADGWPTVDELRGHVLFSIDGRCTVGQRPEAREHAYDYSRGWSSLRDRAAFVPAEPFHDVAGLVCRSGHSDQGESKYERIRRVVAQGFLVRDLVGPDGFEDAKAAGVHFISSDHPEDLELSDHPHAPSRCNPVTASTPCRDHWLERRAEDDIGLPDEPGDGPEDALADQVDRLVVRSVGSAAAFGRRAADDPQVAAHTAERQAEVWRRFLERIP